MDNAYFVFTNLFIDRSTGQGIDDRSIRIGLGRIELDVIGVDKTDLIGVDKTNLIGVDKLI